MQINDDNGTLEATTDQELEAFLTRRHEMDGVPVNSFMMSHREQGPVLSMLVREEMACQDYMADSSGTAFTSQGDMPGLAKDGMTEFCFYSQRQPVLNSHVVSVAEAVRAAKEFLHAGDLPKSIRWLRL
jgi:hypothetical protein